MTVTTRNATRSRQRGWRRLASAAFASFVVATTFLVAPSAVADPVGKPDDTTTERPLLTASPTANGLLNAGDQLKVTATVDNSTQDPITSGNASLWIGTSQLSSRAAVTTWATSASADAPSMSLQFLTQITVPAVGSGDRREVAFTVPATDKVLAALQPGSYALQVRYADTTSNSVVTVLDRPAALRARVSLIVPVTAPAAALGVLDRDALAALTQEKGSLRSSVSAAPSGATLAIDPAIVAAIRALGTAAPRTATDWLQEVTGNGVSRFALQFGDADLATQAGAGLKTPLQPTDLTTFVRPESTPATGAAPSPAPTATEKQGVEKPVPTTEDLVDVGANTDAVFWPASGTATTATLALAGGRTTLVSSDQVDTVGSGVRIGPSPALVYDGELARVLRDVAAAPDAPAAAQSAALATALTQQAVQRAGSAPVVIAVERGATLNGDAFKNVLSTVQAVSGGAFIPLSTQLSAPKTAAVLKVPATSDAPRADELRRLLSDERSVANYAVVMDTPSLLTGRERARNLQTLAVSWRDDASGWQKQLEARHRTTSEILGAVSIIQPPNVILASNGSTIPMFVRNELPYPITVDVLAEPTDLRVTVAPITRVRVGPGTSAQTGVAVTSGISNGDVRIDLRLRAADGTTYIGEPRFAELSVRADWERIALIALLSVVVLLLGFGVFRTIRRRRRSDEPRESRRSARAAYRTKAQRSEASSDPSTAEDADPSEEETHG